MIDFKTVSFGCAFCGQDVEDNSQIANFVLVYKGEEQIWFGHAQCFVNAMNPQFRELREEWDDLSVDDDKGLELGPEP